MEGLRELVPRAVLVNIVETIFFKSEKAVRDQVHAWLEGDLYGCAILLGEKYGSEASRD